MAKKNPLFEEFMGKVLNSSDIELNNELIIEELRLKNNNLNKEIDLLLLEKDIMVIYIASQAEMLMKADSLLKRANKILKDKGISDN